MHVRANFTFTTSTLLRSKARLMDACQSIQDQTSRADTPADDAHSRALPSLDTLTGDCQQIRLHTHMWPIKRLCALRAICAICASPNIASIA